MDVAKHLLDLESGANDDDYDDDVFDYETQAQVSLIDESLQLSIKERLIGFAACVLLGWALSMVSLISTSTGNYSPKRFALFYSLGNLLSLCGAMFLHGPIAQLKSMFDETRRSATTIYLMSMFLTMYAAIELESFGIVLIAYIVQLLAMIWYCASYIPYGRSGILSVLSYINPF